METQMIKFAFLGVATILSTAIVAPALAQAVIPEAGVYALHDPDGDLGIGPSSLLKNPKNWAFILSRVALLG
jgi:hypothetical protein